jgi:hypothetical protein
MMSYGIRFGPFNEQNKQDNYEFFAKISYHMYPEMEDEFNPEEYPEEYEVKLDVEDDDNDQWIYKYDVDLPYGDIKC